MCSNIKSQFGSILLDPGPETQGTLFGEKSEEKESEEKRKEEEDKKKEKVEKDKKEMEKEGKEKKKEKKDEKKEEEKKERTEKEDKEFKIKNLERNLSHLFIKEEKDEKELESENIKGDYLLRKMKESLEEKDSQKKKKEKKKTFSNIFSYFPKKIDRNMFGGKLKKRENEYLLNKKTEHKFRPDKGSYKPKDSLVQGDDKDR